MKFLGSLRQRPSAKAPSDRRYCLLIYLVRYPANTRKELARWSQAAVAFENCDSGGSTFVLTVFDEVGSGMIPNRIRGFFALEQLFGLMLFAFLCDSRFGRLVLPGYPLPPPAKVLVFMGMGEFARKVVSA